MVIPAIGFIFFLQKKDAAFVRAKGMDKYIIVMVNSYNFKNYGRV